MFKKLFGAGVIAAASASTVAETIDYQTNNNIKYGHPEIVIRISDSAIPPQDIKTILKGFEEEVSKGVKYNNGESLQLGFMMNQFSSLKDGRLILEEPDMKSFPIKYIPSMNYTFKTLRQQKDIVESIKSNLVLSFPSLSEAIAVHGNYKTSKTIVLERVDPEGSQSGWWVHDQSDSNSENYSLTSIYQLALDRPDLVKFLAFPVGTKAYVIKEKNIKVSINGNEEAIKKGSYLSELNK